MIGVFGQDQVVIVLVRLGQSHSLFSGPVFKIPGSCGVLAFRWMEGWGRVNRLLGAPNKQAGFKKEKAGEGGAN